MPKKQKLKVFRTATGFYDAYVAAPSQKAALAAWGSKHDLFARGVAELVEDPALIEEPLAQPGVVIRRSRGTADEQLAALGPALLRTAKRAKMPEEPTAPIRRKEQPKPVKPKPDRSALDEAERRLAKLEERHEEELAEFERKKNDLVRKQAAEIAEQRRKTAKLRASYEESL